MTESPVKRVEDNRGGVVGIDRRGSVPALRCGERVAAALAGGAPADLAPARRPRRGSVAFDDAAAFANINTRADLAEVLTRLDYQR